MSVDGVRQDFVVTEPPAGNGALRVELDVTGAKAEALMNGARLVLDGSGRKIAYTRLHVVDATGRELPARMKVSFVGDEVTSLKLCSNTGSEVGEMSLLTSAPTSRRSSLAVLVEDTAATYPVRIDPTFSDEDWISLGSGVNGSVKALVTSGSDLYVGGQFTTAGGNSATNVAKWNGSAWSALGSGVNGEVGALAVLGTNLYVAGAFTTAGGNSATNVAKWNGSAWSALGLGLGLNGSVSALAVLGSDLYVGGYFTMAGGNSAKYVAKWNGSAWSALGSGLGGGIAGNGVKVLAVLGSDLYVGGDFTTADGNSANFVAKCDGSGWSALGSGVGGTYPYVLALAVSGNDLYVGGQFTTAGGNSANRVAKWDGSAWSPLGSGVNNRVNALAVSGSDLYVGGDFTSAGGKASTNVARAIGPAVFTSVVPNPSGSEALLTFTTAPGASLHLLSSPDLITWQTNSTINATDVTNSVSVNIAQPREFFRLRRLP